MRNSYARRGAIFVAAMAMLVGACGSNSKANSNADKVGSAKSSDSPITIGLLIDLTGAGAANYSFAQSAVKARVALQNSEGGVDGHPLRVAVADTTSTPTGAQTAAQVLVNQDHAFVVVAASLAAYGAAKYLHQVGEPVVGDGEDGPEWGTQPYTNMFRDFGNINPTTQSFYNTTIAQLMKEQGAANVGTVAYQVSPSSTASGKGFIAGAENLGLKGTYTNYSLPLSGLNATAIALGMKQSDVQGLYAPILQQDVFSVITAAQQEGVHLKAAVLATGYGQQLLSQPAAVQAGQGAIYQVSQVPVEEKTPATVAEMNALSRYGGYTGIPSINVTFGWLSTDLAIRGIQAAGSSLTKSAFITNLRKVTDWDGGGLIAHPADFSLSNFGHDPKEVCDYFVTLHGTDFAPVPADGKPVCGSTISGT